MMSEAPSDPSTHLQPPSKTTEVEDPGAEGVASNSDEEHFSDASEGHVNDQFGPQSDGTPAGLQDRPLTPGGSPIPRTMVEKIDPESPSHGEVPGTEAFEKRQADAAPDLVRKADSDDDAQLPSSTDHASPEANSSDQSIPETKISRVDTFPTEEELPSRPHAHSCSASDAMPDTVETTPDGARETIEDAEGGDDFDEFVEEQNDMGDDDFGDFDDGFQEPGEEVAGEGFAGSINSQQPYAPSSAPPLIDFDAFNSTSELLSALQGTLDQLLPSTKDLDSLPPVESISDSSAIFSSERSLSLWSQLVAPPPLQPQNWVKSRIRRLFLVSLGVPVDLDEILPASKQKKLILPSIDLDSSGATTPHNPAAKEGDGSQTATASGQAPARSKTTRRGAPPPPELDLPAVRRLCTTTDAALGGLTDTELKQHVTELEQVTLRASAVLEHWLKRRDGLVGEKEAFEGVIENLVSHVRRVRK